MLRELKCAVPDLTAACIRLRPSRSRKSPIVGRAVSVAKTARFATTLRTPAQFPSTTW